LVVAVCAMPRGGEFQGGGVRIKGWVNSRPVLVL